MTKDPEPRHGSLAARRTVYNRIVRLGRRCTMLIGLPWALACACGSEPTSPVPPPLASSTSRPPERDAGPEERDAFVLTPVETSSMFVGTLATTETVPFGGDGFCKYDITLRDVSMEIELLATGDVGQAAVRDLAVERALEGCPYAPAEPSIQEFTVKSAAVTTTGTRVDFMGAKDNRPATSLVVDLVQTAGGYDATATWKRTDQGPPLAWSVTAKIALTKK